MKPILKYRGGKSKELSEILPHFPKFKGRFIEPFIGGGSVYFHLEKSQNYINDINGKLIQFYLNLRDNFAQVREELKELETLYKSNRARFEALKERFPKDKVPDENEALYYKIRGMFNGESQSRYEWATVYFFINKLSYSGMIRYNAKGEFNVPYGRYANFNTSLITENHISLLKRTEISNLDYSEVFNECKEGDFLFLDPPYDCVFKDYGNQEGFSEGAQVKLAQDFKNLSSPTVMVIGETPLTLNLYKGKIVHKYKKDYAVNIKNRFKSEAYHLVVKN